MAERGRMLVIGATGYIGRFITIASLTAGLQTRAMVRRPAAADDRKNEMLNEFTSLGAEIVFGSLDDYESLIRALTGVDMVVSAVGIPQILDQLLLIEAIKEVGTVKRFLPSEFGQDVDKVTGLKPCQDAIIEPKIRVRRATEAAGIPYTYVITNGFAKFHFNMQETNGRLSPPNEIVIYGDGNAKASFVVEEDIGFYTIRAASDPRTINKTLHIRPPTNACSRNETVAAVESITGNVLSKKYVTKEELLEEIKEASGTFKAVILSLMYSAHIKGDTFSFDLGPTDVEACDLYPEFTPTDAHSYLSRFVALGS